MINKIVSVIIPMYNSEKTIKRTLNSVINQSYKNFEVIIVNDGSTDNSPDIVEQFIKSNSSYDITLVNQNNQGVSVARNNGIKLAKGQYIAFLDSDDYWETNKLYEQIKIMGDNADIYLLGTLPKSSKDDMNTEEINYIDFRKLLFKNYFMTSSVMIRKEVFSTVGYFNTQKKYSEDYDLWLRISQKYKTAIYMKKLVNYSSESIGLSDKLVEMEKGELNNYYSLYKNEDIGFPFFVSASIFSVIKFIRRLVLNQFIDKQPE